MFSKTDYDKLHQIMEESSEKKELLSRLLNSHQITISTISHEIRNPLTLIYSTMQLIESSHPEVHTFQHWSDMQNDICYMKLLLEELSAYNNGNHLHLTCFHTDSFFKTLALSFASSLIETDIQFVSKIDTPLPAITADMVKLREVFLNLLNNAKEALTEDHPANQKASKIHLSVSNISDHIEIVITDNGSGISREQLPHIFEPFVTYKKNGTGLGLALASKIVNAHHGKILVSSIPHVSTSFTVTLPVKQNTEYESGG